MVDHSSNDESAYLDTAPISTRTHRRGWRRPAAAVAVVAALAATSAVTLLVANVERPTVQAARSPDTEALQHWWAASHGAVEALVHALDDAQMGLAVRDPDAVATACQQIHDAGELRLKARLPSPNSDLTADLTGAIEDAHAAAHMCLAARAGSPTDHVGEFGSYLEQAARQLRAGQELVNDALSQS